MAYLTLIDPTALAALVERRAVALFDCGFDLADPAGGRARFVAGHVPGAAYLHLDDDLAAPPSGANGRHPLPDRATLARGLARAGARAGEQIVAYDEAGGAFAARLWWMVKWLGHEEVAVLDGGLPAWKAAGLPLEAGEASPRAVGDFAAAAAPGRAIVGADEILRGAVQVIDARAPERFGGAPHPLDAVPGHIPGAVNLFYRDNLGPDGRFLPPVELRRRYAGAIGGRPPGEVAVQCGSGVTATHSLLAMEHAGLAGARLYPGSWSEWVSDPARPIAPG